MYSTCSRAAEVLATDNQFWEVTDGSNVFQLHVLDVGADTEEAALLLTLVVKTIKFEACVVAIDGNVMCRMVSNSERDEVKKLAFACTKLDIRALRAEKACGGKMSNERGLLLEVLEDAGL